MDLGTAPLFDLPAAPAAGTIEQPLVPVIRTEADRLPASIAERRRVITDQQLAQVREIAEWAHHHTVDVPEDASTLTERGLDTGPPLAGEGRR